MRKSFSCLALLLITGLLGCSHSEVPITRNGPGMLAPVRVENWTYDGSPAKRVVTEHYIVYATVTDDDFLESMGQLMEGALAEYRQLAPDVPESDRPMECYLFANRPQWAQFTKAKTGDDAAVYLQINRGGYTVRDWYVAYFLGDVGTFCVASHEGFHQYAARHFRSRIPPFLEEGLACMFEDVTWDGRLPRWDLSTNYGRQTALRKAVDKKILMPLSELAEMHAGQIINKTPDQIAGFYAQCWAFARFLWEYNNGQYRPALQKILTDATDGNLFATPPSRTVSGIFWNPRSAKPLLENYLGADIQSINKQYQAFMVELAAQQQR
ncbi:MAG TPA: hypothetical protein VFE47_17025 [Tepidisphaeraceae bacterium]|jgi:hypothetical protein|nr:hypothetical protein [Tepidisphaeraceae bacterium]